MGYRTPASHILTEDEIVEVESSASKIKVPLDILAINFGAKTGYSDFDGLIHIKGDILPDMNSTDVRDRLSVSAVLAHEYYGHYLMSPSPYEAHSWEDEYHASRNAALKAPNLTIEERGMLMIDAYNRAKEAGILLEYDDIARKIIYGY